MAGSPFVIQFSSRSSNRPLITQRNPLQRNHEMEFVLKGRIQ